MANKTPNFNAPLGFKEILHDFAREVLKFHPDDILEFGADYFESLIQGKLLENDPKYINLREKPHLKELAEKKIISKENEQKINTEENYELAVKETARTNEELSYTNSHTNILFSEPNQSKDNEKFWDSTAIKQEISKENITEKQKEALFLEGVHYIPKKADPNVKDETSSFNQHSISTIDHSTAAANQLKEKNYKLITPVQNQMKKSENNHEIEKNENNNNDKVLNTEINENNLLNIESNTPSKDKNVYGDQNINQNMIIIDEDIEKKFNLPSETLYENEILPAATKNEQNSDGIIKINVVNLRGEDLPFDLLISLKIVELPELPELLVRAINENKTPEWYFRGKINLNLEQRSKNLNLLITLKGKKNDEFIDLASNRLDLTEVLDNDEKWAFNNYIELQPSLDSQILPPMIYLQLRWLLSRKIYPDYDSEPTDVNELEKTILKPIFQENHAQFKGFLHLNIVKAKNLKPKDEFLEPFCEFWFSHKRNEKEYTILITPTLKPVWNERRVFDLGKVKVSELNLSKLIICVWNKDQIGEDYLGGIVFNLKDIIEEENEKWLNGWFQLKDDHSMKTNCGEIYLQLGYFKDKKDKNETQPPILD